MNTTSQKKALGTDAKGDNQNNISADYSNKHITNQFVITLYTSKNPKILTKHYTLKPDGTLHKEAGGSSLPHRQLRNQ